MALDKIVDSTQLDADLTTVANAIRTKGGTSEQLSFPSGMAQAIAAIPSGGSLPSVISKIDGGSFTPASDTLIGNYTISHNLDEAPKGVVVFSNNTGGAYSVLTVSWACKVNTGWTNEVMSSVATTGSSTNWGTQNLTPNGLTTAAFFFKRNNVYYKAGATYNWLAWA